MCFGTPYTNSKKQSSPNVSEVHRPIATVVSGMLSVLFGFLEGGKSYIFIQNVDGDFVPNIECAV